MREMTNRERLLAVLKGEPHDRVPFVQYDGLAAPTEEMWAEIGRSDLGVLHWTRFYSVEHPNCLFEEEDFEQGGLRGLRTTLHTPEGSLFEERLFEPVLNTSHASRHYIQEPDDYRILRCFLQDAVITPNIEALTQADAETGDDGLPLAALPRTPYQQLWVQWVCIENLCLHLVDCPTLVEDCTSLMEDIQRAIFDIAVDTPLHFVDFPDNITAPVIGEAYFRRYCVPLYDELADRLADKGTPVFVHMDGDVKPLRHAIAESRVRGIDSFSPAPDNDTTVGEAVEQWPGMLLFINFPSSMHLARPEAIYEQAMTILEQGGHTGRLEIQISENVPPGVWRTSVPQIVKAITDFGTPG